MRYSGGEASLAEKPLPRAPSEEAVGDDGGCEGGGFSERSPSLALPPEERLAFELGGFFYLVPPASWARGRCGVAEVTAADRAAAPIQRRERCELGCLK